MESVINIQSIADAAKAGDQASFETLYQYLADRVFSFVFARTGNRTAALDVTQDTFVELYKSLPSFTYQSDAAFYSFVYTIARRQLAQYYAKTHKHAASELDEATIAGGEPGAELTTDVQRALTKLDDCSREIVVLHHWARYTFAEIGTLINMTESAVRVRHHRARAELANILTR
jgi:RNA polymerase sigma-70 factor (ECF subfamily)